VSSIRVRTIDRETDFALYCRLIQETFRADDTSDEAVQRRGERYRAEPWYDPDLFRGAFDGDALVGGYLFDERVWRIGAARVRTACLGAVCVLPDRRGEGIGAALVEDVLPHARERGLDLVLLDGVPGYYRRFGYVDVHDYEHHIFARADVAALPRPAIQVRDARAEDAPALLELFDATFSAVDGSFVRDLRDQRWRLAHKGQMHVAIDERQAVRGYAASLWRADRSMIGEIAVADEEALHGMLHWHAGLVAPEVEDLRWFVPRQSWIYWKLNERVTLRSERNVRHNAHWMAAPTDPARLLRALAPDLLGRHLPAAADGPPPCLAVDNVAYPLPVAVPGLTIGAGEPCGIVLTGADFTQLALGYRPSESFAVPPAVRAELASLFPSRQLFIPGTDTF